MKTAQDVIDTIRGDDQFIELIDIRYALEDGECLLNLGFTDDDRLAIDEAHDIIIEMIKKGLVTL